MKQTILVIGGTGARDYIHVVDRARRSRRASRARGARAAGSHREPRYAHDQSLGLGAPALRDLGKTQQMLYA